MIAADRTSATPDATLSLTQALLHIECILPHAHVFVGLIYEALQFDCRSPSEALAAQGKLHTLM
ncbi:MAG: hypothetical protein WAW73_20440, partial [Rhodoferax sp.]